MRKIQNIQALRGIAVLLVVFSHILPIEYKYGGSITILPSFLQFGIFGVDLFFVISGFVMVTVTRGKFLIRKEAIRFIYHRVSRIYPMYWVYSLLVLVMFLLRPEWVNSSQGNQVEILSSFLLLPSSNLPLVMVGWTLIHEMYFYLVFFFMLILVSERYFLLALFLWSLGVVLINGYQQINSPIIHLISHPLTFEFIGGCFVAIIYYKNKNEIKNSILFTMIGLGLFASFFGYVFYQNITGLATPFGWWRILMFGVPASLIVFCLMIVERNGYVVHPVLIEIGSASYSIYLSHILTLSAVGRIWGEFSTDNIFDNVLMIPILLAITLAVGITSHRIVEKPLLKISRILA